MPSSVILASASEIRQKLLRQAGLEFDVQAARVDEKAIRDAMLAEKETPRDIADALAETKALKVSNKVPDALVIGCDQILAFEGKILSKPRDKADAISQLSCMRGTSHELLSAVVICEAGRPVWREIGRVRLTMRPLSDNYLNSYVERNWQSIQYSVGSYKLEEEGIRLFSAIQGDYFSVLGLPMLGLISYLTTRKVLEL